MSDLTRYWHDESVHLEPCDCMVPDSTLQAIADEWGMSWQKEIRELSPELAALLDALEGTNDE